MFRPGLCAPSRPPPLSPLSPLSPAVLRHAAAASCEQHTAVVPHAAAGTSSGVGVHFGPNYFPMKSHKNSMVGCLAKDLNIGSEGNRQDAMIVRFRISDGKVVLADLVLLYKCRSFTEAQAWIKKRVCAVECQSPGSCASLETAINMFWYKTHPALLMNWQEALVLVCHNMACTGQNPFLDGRNFTSQTHAEKTMHVNKLLNNEKRLELLIRSPHFRYKTCDESGRPDVSLALSLSGANDENTAGIVPVAAPAQTASPEAPAPAAAPIAGGVNQSGLQIYTQLSNETKVAVDIIQHNVIVMVMTAMRVRVDSEIFRMQTSHAADIAAQASAREREVASLETRVAGLKRKYMDVLERLEAGERGTVAPSADKLYGGCTKRYKTLPCGVVRKMGPLLPKCVCIKGGRFMWQYVLHGTRTVQRGFDTPQHALNALIAYKASL